MFRIEKQSDGRTAIVWLSGRIRSSHISEIQAQMDEGVRMTLDLREVTLVDLEVVRFLSGSERAGIKLAHCPPYVREWILRERAKRE